MHWYSNTTLIRSLEYIDKMTSKWLFKNSSFFVEKLVTSYSNEEEFQNSLKSIGELILLELICDSNSWNYSINLHKKFDPQFSSIKKVVENSIPTLNSTYQLFFTNYFSHTLNIKNKTKLDTFEDILEFSSFNIILNGHDLHATHFLSLWKLSKLSRYENVSLLNNFERYQITHDFFYLTNFGIVEPLKTQKSILIQNASYFEHVIKDGLIISFRENNVDLLAEFFLDWLLLNKYYKFNSNSLSDETIKIIMKRFTSFLRTEKHKLNKFNYTIENFYNSYHTVIVIVMVGAILNELTRKKD